MDDIPAYDPQKGSQIEQAFEELKKPVADPQSCLRIAGAYLNKELSQPEAGDGRRKGSLIRWLVVEALHTNPSLFISHADELQAYFSQLLTHETTRELKKRSAADVYLSTLRQGEAFSDLNSSQREALTRLRAHKPLVISLAYAGLGDIMLMTPMVEDLSKVVKLIGSKSKIRFLIKRFLVDIVRAMLYDCDNVEVIPFNYGYTSIYPSYIASLAVEHKIEVLHDAEKNPFLPAIPNYEEQTGVIIGWEKAGQDFSSEKFLKGTFYEKFGRMVSLIQPTDNFDKHIANTFRRCAQRGISSILGLKIFDADARDDITTITQGLDTFLEEYLRHPASEGARTTLTALQGQAGFDNGYICVISQGTTGIKKIIPELAEVIAVELEDFCQQNRPGVVLIRSGNKDETEELEYALIAARFLAHSIPVYAFRTTDSIPDTLVLLRKARGVIGPDTFLTHAAEFFQATPVVNCFADSARRVYRLDRRMIAVQHPMARRAEEQFRNFIRDSSELFTREIVHPFDPLLTADEQKRFHPLIQEVQKSLLRELRSGLSEMKRRIIQANNAELATAGSSTADEQHGTMFHRGKPTLVRFAGNPIISPGRGHDWEEKSTFNPAALYEDGKVHILYRALARDYTSTFGYAVSKDGLHIDERLNEPIYIPREAFEIKQNSGLSGCEDPRITRIDDSIYMTYVAYDSITNPRIALTSISVDDFLNRRWTWAKPRLISTPGVTNKNAVLFPEKVNGKYVLFHRVFPDILLDFVDDLEFHSYLRGSFRIKPRRDSWDSLKVGTGAPPIKTKDGWLLIYHAVGLEDRKCYKIGAMLLDLNDPTRVLYRSNHPILEPESLYENQGRRACTAYPGAAVIINDMLHVYYGGADSVVCVASQNLEEFLARLKSDN